MSIIYLQAAAASNKWWSTTQLTINASSIGNLEVPATSLLRPLGPFFGFSHSRLLFSWILLIRPLLVLIALLVRIGAFLRLLFQARRCCCEDWGLGRLAFRQFRTVFPLLAVLCSSVPEQKMPHSQPLWIDCHIAYHHVGMCAMLSLHMLCT